MRAVKILSIKSEISSVKSFLFNDKKCREAKSGQYIMVWIPRVDEIPLTLSVINHLGNSMITVKEIGGATRALHNLKVGDIIGIRGPFGNWFKSTYGKVIVVGGGIGTASLTSLLEDLKGLECDITFILGVKTRDEILFLEELQTSFSDNEDKLIIATEDGSYGSKGTAVDVLSQLIKETRYDMLYTCGPESMMRKIFDIADEYKVPVQACLERIIRCSVGLCGSCLVGKYRICKEGPIFTSNKLKMTLNEFGKFKKDVYGLNLSIK